MVVGHGGVVASGHPSVSSAGVEILRRGGNAVDAAVGAFFTAFHAEPLLASPAGAGFMVAEVDREPVAWDFFAVAPGLGTGAEPYQPPPDAFWAEVVDFGSATQAFHIGPGSVAVPGALAGLCTAQREAGRLSLAEVLEPARAACESGTPTMGMGAFVVELLDPIVRSNADFERFFINRDGKLLRPGDTFHNPELGRFYQALAEAGSADLLYDGPLTDLLVDTVAGRGGGLTREDLRAYTVRRTRPLEVPLAGGTAHLLLTPPVSSGGMLIAYAAALLEAFPVPPPGSRDDVLLLRAVMAQTLHARTQVIGGTTPDTPHVDRLLDPAHVEAGQRRVRTLLAAGAGPLPEEPPEAFGWSTTQVSVIDAEGNACAVTISNGECSGLVLPGYGVLINNFLGEQDINPEGYHRFPPGARMGSSMAPLLLRQADGTITAMGSGGSNRIRNVLLQVVRNLVAHGQTPQEAVLADRMHYEDGTLYAEVTNRLSRVVRGLAEAGTRVAQFQVRNMFFGGAHVATRRPDGTVMGMGDDRRSGAAAVSEPR
jgi:gamma-glutamyltranspeptidase/glutathione hydrolase